MIVVESERKIQIPKIIGLSLQEIAQITLEGLETDKVKIAVFEDSFVPPAEEVRQIVQKLVKAVEDRIITKKGFPSLCDSEKTVVAFSSEIDQSDALRKVEKTEISSPLVFRITSPSLWKKAVEISCKIKTEELESKGVWIEGEAFISFDSNIESGCVIEHGAVVISSEIQSGTRVGKGSHLINCKIGKNCEILPYCYLEGLETEDEVKIGPFARVRPETRIGKGSKIGNFAEIKNSKIGKEVKIQHFSYTGDATVGDKVNIGAGTVTCNWDGVRKNHTLIEEGAFIGSGTMLVAPLKIGKWAYIGAGSTITRDVPDWALAVERSEQKIFPDWVKRKFGKKEE